MGSDPEPGDSILDSNAQGAVVQTNSNGLKVLDTFQPKRWMPRIRFEQRKRLVGERPHICRQGSVENPELRRCVVVQIFVDFSEA